MGVHFSKKKTTTMHVDDMVRDYMSMRVKKSWDTDRAESQIIHNLLSLLLVEERRLEFLGKEVIIRVEIAPGKEELETLVKEEEDQMDNFPAST